MALGPGQELAEVLIRSLSEEQRDILDRWSSTLYGNRDKNFISGFLAGLFMDKYSMVAINNAARAIAEGEAKL